MIVYNVRRRWFTMKNDAEGYRKLLGLPPSATYTLRIDDREGLAALLNGLCGGPEPIVPDDQPVTATEVALREVIHRAQVTNDPPDFVPAFLVKDWENRLKGIYR